MRTFHHGTVAILLLLASLLASGARPQVALGWQTVTAPRLAAMLKDETGVWAVDVRNSKAFEESHIEGALNIPLNELASKRLPPQKIIVLVDESLGLRHALEGARVLEKKGITKLYILDGGLVGWQKERLPLTSRGREDVRQVTPEELARAISSGVSLKIYDLRDRGEQQLYPLENAMPVKGETPTARLKQVKELLAIHHRKSQAKKLEGVSTAVLVLPMTADVKQQMEDAVFGLSADIRYMDGGYAAWMAKPQSQLVKDPTGAKCSQGESVEAKK